MIYDIIESVYQHYNDVPTNNYKLDLQQTETDLEEFKAEFFPTMDSEFFFNTVEDKIRTIFLRERENAFRIGFTAGLSLLSEVMSKEM